MLSYRTRVFFCITGLLFGAAILSISLVAASQPFSSVAPTATHASIYLDSRMLPDHALYPFAMALDRVILLTSPQEKRVLQEVALSFDRLDSVTDLLKKDNAQLALVTLKKSQHYLLLANISIQEDADASPTTRAYVRRALRAHIKRTVQLQAVFSSEEQQAVSQILQQSASLYNDLPAESL